MENNNNELICSECGEIISGEYFTTHDGKIICEECYHENYARCAYCENIYHRLTEMTFSDSDNEYVCDDCFDDNYSQCDYCEEYHHNDNLRDVDGRLLCDTCLYDETICCRECGDIHLESCMHYDEDEDDYYCDECYNDNFGWKSYITSYHRYNRNWKKYYSTNEEKLENKDNIYTYGHELEIEGKNNTTEKHNKAIQFLRQFDLFLSHDSSLNNSGFEIVSQPQSFEFYMEHKEDYKNAFNKLIECNLVSHDSSNCGLHFHVSRPKDNAVIDKLWLVLETFKDEIIQLSRRTTSQLKQWSRFLSTESNYYSNEQLKSLYFIKRSKSTQNSTRYLALNNTNSDTIEFRFFKGTLKYETFFASLEFIHNLMELCTNEELKNITWKKLTTGEFISSYVKERNIICNKKISDKSLQYVKMENKLKAKSEKCKKTSNNILKITYRLLNNSSLLPKDVDLKINCIYHLSENIYNFKKRVVSNNENITDNASYLIANYDDYIAHQLFPGIQQLIEHSENEKSIETLKNIRALIEKQGNIYVTTLNEIRAIKREIGG